MEKKDELRRLIIELVNRMEDEKLLRRVYILLNRLFCRK